MKIKKNGKVIRLNESDLKRIVKRVLSEGASGGCKCPDGTLKPECCNTEAQKDSRTKRDGMKNVLSSKYFESNPKGTLTLNYSVTKFNGSENGIISPEGVPDFNELWSPAFGGRGFNQGNGKFTYLYRPNVKTIQGVTNKIEVTNAPDNPDASCKEGNGMCYYYQTKMGKEFK